MAIPRFTVVLILVIFYSPTPTTSDYWEPGSPAPSPVPSPSRGVKAAYWASFNAFPATAIDTSYFTHIYYAFLLPEPITFNLNVTPFDQTRIPQFISAIRAKSPPVKTLLSIGGASDPTVFSEMASSWVTRQTFIYSSIEVARRYGFDGVDLDWEFPSNDSDMSNLGLLYKQWREAILAEARNSGKPPLLLTSAVYYASKLIFEMNQTYPVESIRNYVDWINPMCYDYHGSWENFTGMPSALNDPDTPLSTHFGILSWIQAGVPPNKIVMGLPLYGRTWTLQNSSINGIGAPAIGPGPGGGVMNYNQVIDFIVESSATVVFDGRTTSYYAFAGDSWVGYDDVQSARLKVLFARSRMLGGYFFWALGGDQNWTISRLASNTWGDR